ncbi:MAG TPA: DUF4126 domain-containing protein [Planctomycetota bacterium]|nr:DUF4126 domain-containing protein [Planctomycetota bacterium]
MDIVYQIMMGVSLAACAGFRAWLPLFVAGIMAKTGHIHLNESMLFLQSTPVLAIFGIASVLEFCGDKIIVIDHFLDAVGTVARPVAGTLLVSSMITKMDGSTAMILGLIAGGGTAFTMHSGKAVMRAKATVLSPLHGGIGNAVLSIGEDILSGFGSVVAVFWPVLAFAFTIFALIVAGMLIYVGWHAGKKLVNAISSPRVDALPQPAYAMDAPQTYAVNAPEQTSMEGT